MRQTFCWRGWWRQLRGPWRASTSNHVRRSSITTQRLRAIFASTSAGMLNSFVPRTMHRALPTAVSGVFSMVMLLVARTPKLLLAWVVAIAAWTVARFDF